MFLQKYRWNLTNAQSKSTESVHVRLQQNYWHLCPKLRIIFERHIKPLLLKLYSSFWSSTTRFSLLTMKGNCKPRTKTQPQASNLLGLQWLLLWKIIKSVYWNNNLSTQQMQMKLFKNIITITMIAYFSHCYNCLHYDLWRKSETFNKPGITFPTMESLSLIAAIFFLFPLRAK